MTGTAAGLAATWPQVLAWRMRRQLLDPVGQVDALDVVRRLCGVQAQVPAAAALAIGVRQASPVPGAVDQALADGRLMRTWAMRGTLHLLPPDEAGAYLALMAAGRSWEKGSWVKAFGVTPGEMVELTSAVAEVLDGQVLTREDLVAQLGARLRRPDLEAELRRSWFAALGDDLATVDVEGTSAYLLAEDVDDLAGTAPTAAVRLLPAFDQYVLGPGTAATEVLDRDRRAEVSRAGGWISPVVVAAGRVAGVWDRDGREIDVRLFDDAAAGADDGALAAAIERMRDVVSALGGYDDRSS